MIYLHTLFSCLLSYNTAQVQYHTHSHMQLCSRFLKIANTTDAMLSRGNCFAHETTWQLYRSQELQAKQLPCSLLSDF